VPCRAPLRRSECRLAIANAERCGGGPAQWDQPGAVIALLTTTDPVKVGAIQALLRSAGVESEVFDRAAGTLWTSIIPLRLMIANGDAAKGA
jgi:hypothetical protein